MRKFMVGGTWFLALCAVLVLLTVESATGADTPQEKIQQLEQFLKENPGVFDKKVHNELRHLYITSNPPNPRKAMEHSNVILQHSFMDSYILNILSDWQIDKNTSTARSNLLRSAQSFPDLRFITAACFLKIGDLYTAEGNLNEAKSSYLKVAQDKSSDMTQYRGLAEQKLGEQKPQPAPTPPIAKPVPTPTPSPQEAKRPQQVAGSQQAQPIQPAPLISVLGNAHKAITFLTQMITLAKQNGGEGQEAQLEALKQQIEALPKPKRGDRQAARLQNDKGLEAFKKEQHEQALQFLLTAYQLDPGDVEVVNNVGMAYLKTGNLPEAARYLGGALSLAPTRAAAWGNLAEVFAHDSRPEEAVAAYALTYRYSKNKDATRRLLEAQTTNDYDPQVMQAAKVALALPLISGGLKEQPAPTPRPQEVERPQQEAPSQQVIQSAASKCTGDQIEKMINAGFSKEEIVRLCETTTESPAKGTLSREEVIKKSDSPSEHSKSGLAAQETGAPEPTPKEFEAAKEPPSSTPPTTSSVQTPMPCIREAEQVQQSSGGPRPAQLSLRFCSIVADKSEQGWISYKVAFAAVNQTASSIYIDPDVSVEYAPRAGTLAIRGNASTVETREGQPYPAKPSFGKSTDILVLPPGIPITARKGEVFTVAFRVPELLHPNRVVINPGVVSASSPPQPLIFELNTPKEQSDRAPLPTKKFPTSLRVGTIELSLGPTVSERVEVLYWLPKGAPVLRARSYVSDPESPTYVSIEFNAKNTDITADRPLNAWVGLVDETGGIYEQTSFEKGNCRPLVLQNVGPGQTYHSRFCFTLPGLHAIQPAPLILGIVGSGTDELVTIDPPQLANCVENPKLPDKIEGAYTYPVVSNKAFSVPGQVSGTLDRKSYHRLHFRGQKGKTIDISVSPRLQGFAAWDVQLSDPSGTPILQTMFPKPSNSAPDLDGIPLLCDGTYSLYIHPSNAESNYTVSVRVR